MPELYRLGRVNIADLARLVVRAAEQGDRVAMQILDQNMTALAQYMRPALAEHTAASVPVVLVGGFVTAAYTLLQPLLEEHLANDRAQFRLLERRPVWGALRMAGMPESETEENDDA